MGGPVRWGWKDETRMRDGEEERDRRRSVAKSDQRLSTDKLQQLRIHFYPCSLGFSCGREQRVWSEQLRFQPSLQHWVRAMPVRRGHVAPQNTFLDTIIRKFEGQSKYEDSFALLPVSFTPGMTTGETLYVSAYKVICANMQQKYSLMKRHMCIN